MTLPLVSIIVPAYNAALFLPQCLESLLSQSLSMIEILVVDDASTDETIIIAQEYASRDNRVRLLRNTQNIGVSAARNLGIQNARGAYIGFCDADDWAEPAQYESLYNAASKADAQVSFCAVYKELPGKQIEVTLPWADGTCFNAKQIATLLVPNMIALYPESEELPISGYTPRNLFARELIQNSCFEHDIHYAEDLLFIVSALLRAERVVVVNQLLYHYRFHEASVTKGYKELLESSQRLCYTKLNQLFEQRGMADKLSARMQIRRRRDFLSQCLNFCLQGTPYRLGKRIQAVRHQMCKEDTRRAFSGLRLIKLPIRLQLKYALMKYRMAIVFTLVFSIVNRTVKGGEGTCS